MSIWLAIIGMAIVTFATRALFILPGDRLRFPAWLRRALRFVPAAVLSALIVPMALAPAGSLWLDWRNPWLIGTLVAGLIAWLSQRPLLAMLLSFVVYAFWSHAIQGIAL
ncbi:AzlD domain-containing protein [Chitinilyticum litopenaei]|uniref:AzlD domain-containing protein n=1 Tax=Chitinilyticum litopenaei TaxID=1121276 RepID=UPI00042698AA|nr:AzlD domain-containing protein [Chitinilyticum litopenaei]